jgi:hypothetical protein
MTDAKELLKGQFGYFVRVYRPDGSEDESQFEFVTNLVPTEGLNHILTVLLKGTSQISPWYIGLYGNNYEPQASDTMATFPGGGVAGEITSEYDEATREEFVEGVVAAGAVDNSASPAEFTFNQADTVYGGFIGSSSTKGSTTGVLLSAVKFASPKSMSADGVLRVTAGFTIVSA